jgi:VCBS repeat-containing protein
VFTISITRPNHGPTDIGLSNTSIAENQPVGTIIGTFSTTDPDSWDTHTYTLVSGTGADDNASFTIDAAGNLKTAAMFDFETKSSYSIRVRSTDAGGLWTEKVFNISVTNVNEAPTLTVPPAQAVYEDMDKAIRGITVGDPDSGVLTITLSVSRGKLFVNKTTGLTVTGNGTDAVTLSGSIANLNAALANLVYRGNRNVSGSDTLNITVSDGSLSTSGSVGLSIKSAAVQASELQTMVNALETAGVLSRARARSLTNLLTAKGNAPNPGRIQLFLSKVKGYRQSGILSATQADTLLQLGNILLFSVTRR